MGGVFFPPGIVFSENKLANMFS